MKLQNLEDIDQPEIEANFNEIFQFAIERFRYGAKEYGPYDPSTDKRNVPHEIKEELADVIIYSGMLIMKLQSIEKKIKEGGFHECQCAYKKENSHP